MKLRVDFVTNSSSSSFCIYGIRVEDFKDLLGDEITDEEIEDMEENPWNFFDEKLENTDISYDDMDGTYFIGKSWALIGGEETGNQFKKAVEEEIKKIFPKYKGDFDTYEEAWMDC